MVSPEAVSVKTESSLKAFPLRKIPQKYGSRKFRIMGAFPALSAPPG
jgi:hypothetical protein